jgi:hypothetical protein
MYGSQSTRILRQIVRITPYSMYSPVYYRAPSADYTMNGQQSDTYNIMLASLGTTPLKIIYAGRLEYARVCVFASSAGKRDMWRVTQGRPVDEFF